MTDNLLAQVLEYEQEGMNRLAILSLVQDSLKDIDKSRKAIADSTKAQLKELGCADAVKASNVLCKSIRGADAAERKRLQKRRDKFVTWLKAIFTEYDFSKDAGMIVSDYIGTKEVREANQLIQALTRLNEVGLSIDIPERQDIVDAILEYEPTNQASTPIQVDNKTVLRLQDIAKRATETAARLTDTGDKLQGEESKVS